jgi:hypothetical protein
MPERLLAGKTFEWGGSELAGNQSMELHVTPKCVRGFHADKSSYGTHV